VEDGAQGVDVAGRPDLLALAAGLLGGHVGRRAHEGARRGLADVIEPLRQPEVGDLWRAVIRQQDVVGLEVAVDNALVVRRLHRPRQHLHQPG
jgi:hypothetical protein